MGVTATRSRGREHRHGPDRHTSSANTESSRCMREKYNPSLGRPTRSTAGGRGLVLVIGQDVLGSHVTPCSPHAGPPGTGGETLCIPTGFAFRARAVPSYHAPG